MCVLDRRFTGGAHGRKRDDIDLGAGEFCLLDSGRGELSQDRFERVVTGAVEMIRPLSPRTGCGRCGG